MAAAHAEPLQWPHQVIEFHHRRAVQSGQECVLSNAILISNNWFERGCGGTVCIAI